MTKRKTTLNLPIFALAIPLFVFLFFILLTFFNLRKVQVPNIFSLITKPSHPKICPQETFSFRKMFNSVLNTLIINDWQPDGDWKNDMMYDATSFAPYVLYRLGKECQNKNHIFMANKTVEYEVSLIDYLLEELKKRNPNKDEVKRRLYPAIMGHLALIEGVKNYSGKHYSQQKIKLYTTASLLTANFVLLGLSPNQYKDFIPAGFGTITAFALLADDNFLFFRQTKNPLFAYLGLSLLEKANSLFWQENKFGKYYGEGEKPPVIFNQGYMLAALAEAYQLTRNSDFQTKKEAILETLNQKYWSKEYGAYVSTAISDMFNQNIVLSNNNAVFYGLLKWQQTKTDPTLNLKIKSVLSFFEKYLLKNGRIYHHYDLERRKQANYFCSGCNFFTLNNLYTFNREEETKVSPISITDFINFKQFQLDPWIKDYKSGKTPKILEESWKLLQ